MFRVQADYIYLISGFRMNFDTIFDMVTVFTNKRIPLVF